MKIRTAYSDSMKHKIRFCGTSASHMTHIMWKRSHAEPQPFSAVNCVIWMQVMTSPISTLISMHSHFIFCCLKVGLCPLCPDKMQQPTAKAYNCALRSAVWNRRDRPPTRIDTACHSSLYSYNRQQRFRIIDLHNLIKQPTECPINRVQTLYQFTVHRTLADVALFLPESNIVLQFFYYFVLLIGVFVRVKYQYNFYLFVCAFDEPETKCEAYKKRVIKPINEMIILCLYTSTHTHNTHGNEGTAEITCANRPTDRVAAAAATLAATTSKTSQPPPVVRI